MDNLKNRTISGMMWTAVERFGRMGILFVGNLILARLLTPDDFGSIGMLTVFIAIANTFVDSGFGAALIQRKEPTQKDYSTIFYWNLLVAVVLFFGFYLCAPLIADFYHLPSLAAILKVQSFVLILNAFSIIQLNQLTKQLEFRALAKIHLTASFIGVVLGVGTAYAGWGVWSLVVLNLSNAFFVNVIVWLMTRWKPAFCFSWISFKSLFNYGSLILLSSLIETVYTNLQLLIVGRMFAAKTLGFFTQAKKMEEVPIMGLANVVNQVSFSVYSRIQDDKQRFINGLRQSIQTLTFLSFPLIVLLIIIAPSLFKFLLTDKWSVAVPFFQILCAADMISVINSLNVSAIKATGKSNVNLTANLIKKSIGISLIIGGVLLGGMWGLLWALVLDSFVHYLINAFFVSKVIEYSIINQIKIVLPQYLLALSVGVFIYGVSSFFSCNYLIKMVGQCVLYFAVYLFFAYLMKLKAYCVWRNLVKDWLKNRNL
ncbi:MAG: lipopolysaccharide biosynthesis protein [Odoribacter sp.]|jgi:hypothetical protein|nr:lipopolysaccharide biosynthesis protein [Odoribacter sp.]